MPTGYQSGSNTGQYSALDSAMGGTGSYQGTTEASNRWRSYPNNFVYSGFWWGSVAYYRGAYGDYWSRTAYSSDYARILDFYSGSVYPVSRYGGKRGGFTVRCLAPGT